MSTEQTFEFWVSLAWGTPIGLGLGLISFGIFLWLLGKFLVSVSEALKNVKK